MPELMLLMVLLAVIPIAVMGLTVIVASTYYNYLQKRKQPQATLLGVVMPKQNKGEPNA